jgi:two-component system cell cycle response regulator
MTARVLVVDDVDANLKLLEARLSADYFEVRTARSGPEALQICARERADVVLLDVMMPGMDGFEVCRRLKTEPRTQHIPVIMVTALDQPADRVRGLEAGADDFLTKPVDDIALITRVRNLARLKMLTDEMLMRASTEEQLGFIGDLGMRFDQFQRGGRIIFVEDRDGCAERVMDALKPEFYGARETDTACALLRLPDGNFDLMIVSLSLEHADGLRLCSQVRSLDRTRHLPILMITEPGDDGRLLRGLDMGVDDYIVRPLDPNEMLARVRTQVRRKRYTDQLRLRLEESVEMAILDPLTELRSAANHSRCYCSTSTISNRSMTATDTMRATRSCGSSQPGSAATFAVSILPAGWAARSSSWSCPTPTSPRPIMWVNAYANASPRRRSMRVRPPARSR